MLCQVTVITILNSIERISAKDCVSLPSYKALQHLISTSKVEMPIIGDKYVKNEFLNIFLSHSVDFTGKTKEEEHNRPLI